MRIMLMGRFERHEELAGYAQELTDMGHIVTSRWLDPENHHVFPEGTVLYDEKGFSDAHAEGAEQSAEVDMQDTIRAHYLVFFSEHPLTPVVRGARHVEFGMGMGFNIALSMICRLIGDAGFSSFLATNGVTPKRLIIVGPRENIYHCLSESVEVHPDWETAKAAIGNANSASLVSVEKNLVGVDGRPLK